MEKTVLKQPLRAKARGRKSLGEVFRFGDCNRTDDKRGGLQGRNALCRLTTSKGKKRAKELAVNVRGMELGSDTSIKKQLFLRTTWRQGSWTEGWVGSNAEGDDGIIMPALVVHYRWRKVYWD